MPFSSPCSSIPHSHDIHKTIEIFSHMQQLLNVYFSCHQSRGGSSAFPACVRLNALVMAALNGATRAWTAQPTALPHPPSRRAQMINEQRLRRQFAAKTWVKFKLISQQYSATHCCCLNLHYICRMQGTHSS